MKKNMGHLPDPFADYLRNGALDDYALSELSHESEVELNKHLLGVLSPGKHTCYYDKNSRIAYIATFISAGISKVLINLNEKSVHKCPFKFAEFGLVTREVHWLNKLSGSGIVPQLIMHDHASIKMSYVGEPVRQINLPTDWPQQAERILASLKAAKCAHNDIKCDNLLIYREQLHLVDFGWSTREGEPIPRDWPKNLGRQHRLGVHRFDDRHAIFAALRSAELNQIERAIEMQGDS